MKKTVTMLSLIMTLVLVLAACSTAINDTVVPADGMEDTMEKDDMSDDKEDMMEDEPHDDAMKEDDTESDEKKDEMKDDESGMESDTMMSNQGDPAPMFSLMDLNGNTVSLRDFEGEKVYVKYWASWCSICVAGLPEVDALAGMDKDFRVITIVTPDYLGEKSIEDFKEWFGFKDISNLTVLLDVDGTYAKEFGIRAVPTSAYIGSDGVLVKVAPGHVDSAAIEATFETIY